MSNNKTYTTDGKVTWVATEENVNDKLISLIGKKFEDYRNNWQAANNFELETNFPLFLQIETNQICNLKCPMCPIGMPEAHDKYISTEKMDWNMYQKIILEGEKYGCPSVEPQGTNEPLLDPKLEEQIKFAADHGFIDIMMNTNATMLTEQRARTMLKAGLTRIRFSLDAATKETYEKIRIGAKYEVTMRNIERFLQIKKEGDYKLPVVGVNFCKMKLNEHEVDQFIEKWQGIVDYVVIQEFNPPETELDYSQFYPTHSNYRDEMMEGFNCQQPWQRVIIRSTGEVCPCCAFFSTELSIGNIKNHTVHELWNGKTMKDLRQLHKQGKYWENPWCLKCVNSICGKPSSSGLINIKS